jgi:hypothetical protein
MSEPNEGNGQNGEGPKKGDLEAFESEQARELKEFEVRQRRALEAFEHKEHEDLEEFERRKERGFDIKIDRTDFKVHEQELTGAQLRQLPHPPIGPERDLFLVVPGGSDEKVLNEDKVEMRDGLRFFTAPAQINPGAN